MPNVLYNYFDYRIEQRSPIVDDFRRVVRKDEKGEENISFEKFNLAEFQRSLGRVENWSLENLMKAGIDPNFSIHTGYNTRLEGFSGVDAYVNKADEILNEINEVESEISDNYERF